MRLNSQPSARTRQSRQRGFTIVEIVVALMVTAVGVLALAGTAAFVERLAGEGAAQTRAANMAQSRFELLRSSGCSPAGTGITSQNGLIETWTAQSVHPRTWLVTDSVTFLTARRSTQVYRSLVQC
ncbi:MAG TPA: prepilin-type N-terminal cleavage/methylation domain-containing protein [Gemmatimonadaceae bacterium]|nr:prepilin-type N-terminal cleavage/methylation domain-containing protein [Gemmatimonadaceae bacterium]